MTANTFSDLQKKLKLKVNFPDYPTMLIKMFNNCIKDQQTFQAVFTMSSSGHSVMKFLQNIEYKQIELLECEFGVGNTKLLYEHIDFRYKI